jgi:hypothetical protein
MATTKITSPDLFDLGSLTTALQLPSGTTAQRPAAPSTGEWRYNTDNNLIEFYDGGDWRDLQSENIPPIPSENFNTVIWTGTGSAQTIEVGFQPDMIWYKARNQAYDHNVYDSTRGLNVFIRPNSTIAQYSASDQITGVTSTGFTLGTGNDGNQNGTTFVAWCWKANGGTTASNAEGSITSTVQANTAAGFSIVTYTGNGSASQTYGHGLGVEPKMIITKRLGTSYAWCVWQTDLTSENYFLTLDTTAVEGDGLGTAFNSGISSSVVGIGDSALVNANLGTYVSYCFADIAGYSKIGSYTGNALDAGPIINTGFEPAWLMIKVSSGTTDSWFMVDNKRDTSNPRDERLFANSTAIEASEPGAQADFLSNGFQIRGSGGGQGQVNSSGSTYIYIAFAADASTAPTLADSFKTSIYDGTGSARSIGGLGFQPSFIWFKNRTGTNSNALFDPVRGNVSSIYSDLTSQANISSAGEDLTSFDTKVVDYYGTTVGTNNGFSVGTVTNAGSTNIDGGNIVSWCWKAATLPAINTDGDIQSIVSANDAAGFSIVKYDGTSTIGATIGHGLSSAPETVIIKCTSTAATNWINYYTVIGNNDYLTLNLQNDLDTSAGWFTSSATTFTFGAVFGNTNTTGRTYVAYCIKSITGFSKVGNYSGTGSLNAVTTDFEPSFVMIKRTDVNSSWLIFDSARNPSNPRNNRLEPNSNAAATTGSPTKFVNFNSTDFEAGGSDAELNAVGGNYTFVAFKENPAQPAITSGEMEYLVVSGGGGSSSDSGGGAGAGAGGLRTSYGDTSGGGAAAETNITLAAGTYTVTIGGGGTGTTGSSTSTDGVASTISGNATVNTVGGGGGGDAYQGGTIYLGKTGGSGGGSGNGNASVSRPDGGVGTTAEGFAGGGARDYGAGSDRNSGGGGGGASEVGSTGQSYLGGNGGSGLMVAIDGTSAVYAGGGGGGCRGATASNFVGAGGMGGGGYGTNSGAGNAGSTNTGGGAGGGRSDGAAGGSGVVILRLLTADYSGSTTGSPTVTTSGTETILTYTGSGTYVHS